jgi:quercetin dioxygenase-like cupin family protein
MPFLELKTLPEREPVAGYRGRFVHTEHMTVAHWRIAAGHSIPEHHHPHEQVVNVLEGEFELQLGGETRVLGPGSVAVIPSDVPHAGRSVTDCHIIDVFHPVRDDYR